MAVSGIDQEGTVRSGVLGFDQILGGFALCAGGFARLGSCHPCQAALASGLRPGIADQVETAADDEGKARVLAGHVRPYHPGHGVAVGDGKAFDAQRAGGKGQLIRMTGAAQEGKVRTDLQLDISKPATGQEVNVVGGHAKTPSTVHSGRPAACPARSPKGAVALLQVRASQNWRPSSSSTWKKSLVSGSLRSPSAKVPRWPLA